MNLIEKLRVKLRENPWAGKIGEARAQGDEAMAAGYINMAKGYRNGIADALEALGCDRGQELWAVHEEASVSRSQPLPARASEDPPGQLQGHDAGRSGSQADRPSDGDAPHAAAYHSAIPSPA